jgi:hypothetical protein
VAERFAQHRKAELLLERETVDGTDVDDILGGVPGRTEPATSAPTAAATVRNA